jgi:hypothetical protein
LATNSMLYPVPRKNKFQANMCQEFEFPLQGGIWIDLSIV